MALISNNVDAIFNGLSDFWQKMFRDADDLRALYEGTEILLGQAYLNLLSDVLGSSLVEAPLFKREYYREVRFRADQLAFADTPTPMWRLKLGAAVQSVPLLQNRVFAATASLEQDLDYGVADGELRFVAHPLIQNDYAGGAPATYLPGFPVRQVDVAISGVFTDSDVPSFWDAGVRGGDTLIVSATRKLSDSPADAVSAHVVHADPTHLYLDASTSLPTAAGASYYWQVLRTQVDGTVTLVTERDVASGSSVAQSALTMPEMTMWAIDARVDEETLYASFGAMLARPGASTEAYRALLRGVTQLYMFGPAMRRLESALNVIAGCPVVRDDGESLVSYDSGVTQSGADGSVSEGADGVGTFSSPTAAFTAAAAGKYLRVSASTVPQLVKWVKIAEVVDAHTVTYTAPPHAGAAYADPTAAWEYSDSGMQTVTTDANRYLIPAPVPVRADVVAGAPLVFAAFEPLTTAVKVSDYISDPQWWYNISIPAEILPTPPVADPADYAAYRQVNVQLYPSEIGAAGAAHVGDPGYFIGADESGAVPPTQDAPTPVTTYRHKASFILMDLFLKTHLFQVALDPSLTTIGADIDDLKRLIRDVKPSHTAVYFPA